MTHHYYSRIRSCRPVATPGARRARANNLLQTRYAHATQPAPRLRFVFSMREYFPADPITPVTTDVQRPARAGKMLVPAFVLSGLVLIAWPVLVFLSMFMFDMPFRSSFDACLRYLILFSIILYPIVWGRSLVIALRARRKAGKGPLVLAMLAPFLWVCVSVALFLTLDLVFGNR